SIEDVIYKEDGERSVLYSMRYKLAGTADEWITIATQRPETIMGDVAIAVNPGDERYKHLVGKMVLVPFLNREIPVIADNYVDQTFGTGCLKVTPAHDVNDYEIGLRHNLPVIATISEDGTVNEKCGLPQYTGKDRFVVRKQIIKDLREAGHLVKEEEFTTRIGRSERTNTVVEPMLSLQWFIRMKEISVKAKEAVADDEIRLHPAKFKNTYRHWMDNVRDWCISRQLWWGHRIPAWYDAEGNVVVAENENDARTEYDRQFPDKKGAPLKQDPDVLDTWASSWLWPIEVFKGFADEHFDHATGKIRKGSNADLNKFYPTQVLVTAPEILFFWVARMIIAGYEYLDEKPFEDVYLTGIVRDKQGRKMSKSLGNSPDPLELIATYGADGVRTGMLFSSPAGNDLLFDEKLCEQGRNFANKIWNAFRLLKGLQVEKIATPEVNVVAGKWFDAKINQAIGEIEEHFSKFRISDALLTTYKLVWDDFCAWYLELIKPEYGKPIDEATYKKATDNFGKLLKLLHPFMPFITEELWHELEPRGEGDAVIVAEWPKASSFDMEILDRAALAFQIVSEIRNLRNSKGLSPKERLTLVIKEGMDTAGQLPGEYCKLIQKLSNLEEVVFADSAPAGAAGFLAGTTECFVPLESKVDPEKEKESIEKEMEYLRGFLSSIDKKLSNERFVAGAPPAVVELERRKKADAETKLKALEGRLGKG
ncbi:MAG: valine--tRNA ligase, partial [Cyclobacteriaceae bacterium]